MSPSILVTSTTSKTGASRGATQTVGQMDFSANTCERSQRIAANTRRGGRGRLRFPSPSLRPAEKAVESIELPLRIIEFHGTQTLPFFHISMKK